MILEVARAIPAFRTFDYKIPEGEPTDAAHWLGRRVLVPFGRFSAVGLVCGVKPTSDFPLEKIKPVLRALDSGPVLTPPLIDLAKWMSERYLCSWGEALFALLPPGRDRSKPLDTAPPAASSPEPEFHPSPFQLTQDQTNALSHLSPLLADKRHHAALLFGVAAAGKTEVYAGLAEQALKQGRRVLVLAPEIGLVQQIGQVFKDRFGDRVLLYHSDTPPKQRLDDWGRIRRGEVSVVIGPRAASLVPISNLGLVVVDEEQDTAFKEDRKPRFQARDVAEERARRDNALIVFGGATPSLEVLHRAMTGDIALVELSSRAIAAAQPDLKLVDLKKERAKGMLSPTLVEAMGERFRAREQVILFLNKRGFFRYLKCPHCSWVARCPKCNIALVQHKSPSTAAASAGKGRAKKETGYWCHYCGHHRADLKACPDCGKKELFAGGFGTERIEDEVKTQFPWVHTIRWDRDTASKRGAQSAIRETFAEGKFDVMIGTQILAQGLNFPNVTLVGVLDADGPLHIPDFRSPERAFQLICQVAGRSGRSDKKGLVLVQTQHADHPVLHFASRLDARGFYDHEIKFREELFYPPFRHLVQVKVFGKSGDRFTKELEEWGESLQLKEAVPFLGPTPVKKMRGKGATHQFLFKVYPKDVADFLAALRDWMEPRMSGVAVDVDPSSLD